MDRWMTCDFTIFSTVFQSYQDDGWMIMKGCEQWNCKDPRLKWGSNLGPSDQQASPYTNDLPGLHG